ncbi:hypothetical protein AB0878_00580 [Amycolatopsis sp. NPDC047767]|uniref:hypothetical protein n=1 Tax=Amycolatopsis sp. NPDC047767 TaxID=3156765 RepID=UPI0034541A29
MASPDTEELTAAPLAAADVAAPAAGGADVSDNATAPSAEAVAPAERASAAPAQTTTDASQGSSVLPQPVDAPPPANEMPRTDSGAAAASERGEVAEDASASAAQTGEAAAEYIPASAAQTGEAAAEYVPVAPPQRIEAVSTGKPRGRWWRGFTGSIAAGLAVLAVGVLGVGAVCLATGAPGPSVLLLVGHPVAAVAALVLQRVADRRYGRTAGLAGLGVLVVAFVALTVFWWA